MTISSNAHDVLVVHLTFLVTFPWLIEEEAEHNISCFCLGNVDG